MYFHGRYRPRPLASGVIIETVENREGMRVFVDCFNHAYSGTDPKEPYGHVPTGWGETLFSSFGQALARRTVEYYLLRDHGEPASVLLTSVVGDVGGIFFVGTTPDMRGRGDAGTLTVYAVGQLLSRGLTEIVLQTEQHSYNESFYTKFGFSTEWIAKAWSCA